MGGHTVSFGSRLRELRLRERLTQRSLAERVGIDVTYLSKVENDKDDPPGDETIRRLAASLGAESEELLALAGKVPVEIKRLAAADARFAQFLRRLPTLPADELHALYKRTGVTPPET